MIRGKSGLHSFCSETGNESDQCIAAEIAAIGITEPERDAIVWDKNTGNRVQCDCLAVQKRNFGVL